MRTILFATVALAALAIWAAPDADASPLSTSTISVTPDIHVGVGYGRSYYRRRCYRRYRPVRRVVYHTYDSHYHPTTHYRGTRYYRSSYYAPRYSYYPRSSVSIGFGYGHGSHYYGGHGHYGGRSHYRGHSGHHRGSRRAYGRRR